MVASVQWLLTFLAWRSLSGSIWNTSPRIGVLKVLIKVTAIGAGCNAGSLLWEDPVAPSTLELSCPVWVPGVPQVVHPSWSRSPFKGLWGTASNPQLGRRASPCPRLRGPSELRGCAISLSCTCLCPTQCHASTQRFMNIQLDVLVLYKGLSNLGNGHIGSTQDWPNRIKKKRRNRNEWVEIVRL